MATAAFGHTPRQALPPSGTPLSGRIGSLDSLPVLHVESVVYANTASILMMMARHHDVGIFASSDRFPLQAAQEHDTQSINPLFA
jgi:hypothetical protein